MLLMLLKLKSEVPLEVAAKMDFQFLGVSNIWMFYLETLAQHASHHSTSLCSGSMYCATQFIFVRAYIYIYIWKEIQMQSSQKNLILKKPTQ